MASPVRQGPGQPPTPSPPGDATGTNPSDLACAVAPGEGAARQSPVRGVGEGSEGRRGCKRGAAAEPAGGPDTDGLAEGSPAKKKKNAKQKGKGGVASCVQRLVEGGLAAAKGVTQAKVLLAMLEEVCEPDDLRGLLPQKAFTKNGSGPVRKNLAGDKVVEAWEKALGDAALWQKICACNGKAQEAKEREEGQKQAVAETSRVPIEQDEGEGEATTAAESERIEPLQGAPKLSKANQTRLQRIKRPSRKKHTTEADRAAVIDKMDGGAEAFAGPYGHVREKLEMLELEGFRNEPRHTVAWHAVVDFVLSYLHGRDLLHVTPKLVAESLGLFCEEHAHFCTSTGEAAEGCAAAGADCTGFEALQTYVQEKLQEELKQLFDHKSFGAWWDLSRKGRLSKDVEENLQCVIAEVQRKLDVENVFDSPVKKMVKDEASKWMIQHQDSVGGIFPAASATPASSDRLLGDNVSAPHFSPLAGQALAGNRDKENGLDDSLLSSAATPKASRGKVPFSDRQAQNFAETMEQRTLETIPRRNSQVPQHVENLAALCMATGEPPERLKKLREKSSRPATHQPVP